MIRMGARVGMPTMKLDRCNHFGKEDSHSGNARAVLCEAFDERCSSDPDLDSTKTDGNIYWQMSEDGEAIESGNELADMYEKMADNYRVVDKNGKEKKLRSDAGIAFAGIIKPDSEYMETLSYVNQIQFLRDSVECIEKIYEKRGMKICGVVMHLDEATPHVHYTGYDPEYKLGKKLGLKLYRALNVTEYPKMMKSKGWDVEELTGYLEDIEGMKEDEIQEYKAKRRKERKSGKTSKAYKTEKDAERALQEAEDARERAEALRLSTLTERNNADRDHTEILKSAREERETVLSDKKALEDEIKALKTKKDTLSLEVDKIDSTVSERLTEAKKQATEIIENAKKEAEKIKKQSQASIDVEKEAYKNAKKVLDTQAKNVPEDFVKWSKSKAYRIYKTKMVQKLNTKTMEYETKTVYARDENGKPVMENHTPYEDYQTYVHGRKRAMQLSDSDLEVIKKADEYLNDFDK